MVSMRRRNRWVGVAFALAGAVIVTSSFAACGGSESSGGGGQPDSGAPDTGIAADTTPADTSKPDTKNAPDTSVDETQYDAPGSLFDAVIPDVVFDGDVTAAGCYDCALANCHDQVATCDTDARCRGLLLCVLVDCGASTTDLTCLLGCATAYDVSSPTDPVATEALGILTCAQSKCKDKCPNINVDGGFDTASSDAPTAEASSGETGAADASPRMHPPTMSVDPMLLERLSDLRASFEGMPEVRDGLVDHMRSIDH